MLVVVAATVAVVLSKGIIGRSYCIGGENERSNKDLIEKICTLLDIHKPSLSPFSRLIKHVKDRPGHDRHYGIDSSLIKNDLGWRPEYLFNDALELTVKWYVKNQDWCKCILKQ